MSTNLTYQQAFEELQQIVMDLEVGEVNVDELAVKVQRATVLIAACKAKLTETEKDVHKILKDLD